MLLLQLVNARYEKGAMILTSNRGFADNVEEKVGRLDDGGCHLFVAGAREGVHQTLRLGVEGPYLPSGFC